MSLIPNHPSIQPSNHPLDGSGYDPEIFQEMGLSEKQISRILSGTADELFPVKS